MSAAFDGSGYRQRVLAELQRRSPLELDDPFFVAALDPQAAQTDAEVRAHLARVVAFLQRQRSSARYATLAATLVRRRAEWEAPLLDPATREQVRAKVLALRRSGDAQRLAKVARNLATVRERFGGVPRSRVAGLRRLARADGVSADQFDEMLAREPVIEDGSAEDAEPLAPGIRRQIRERLLELRQLRDGDRVATASLWGFLGISPDSPPGRIQAAYEALVARNQRRPHDREKTVTADLLAQVRTRLLEGDPAAYTTGLVADAREEIRERVEEHVVLDGELRPAAFEGLIREILSTGRGLSASQAKALLLDIARDLGAAVTTGVILEYVVCPQCDRPEPTHGSRVCRYCETDLYTQCPSCGGATEAAAVACRTCGHSLRQLREASDALSAIRRALDEGRPRQAGEMLAVAGPVLAALRGPAAGAAEELGARVRAALAAADAGWRALVDSREARREHSATESARWLATAASDVPGPDGRTAGEVLAELVAHQEIIRRRVAAACALPPAEQENALAAVLASVADDREALAALAALPLAPPQDLTATEQDGAVVLRWRPSPSAFGPVSYRVVRLEGQRQPGSLEGGQGAGSHGGATSAVTHGEGVAVWASPDLHHPAARERNLGITWSTELTDAGIPTGVVVRHVVTAVAGERCSEPVSTPGLIILRDVSDLRAEQVGDSVKLTWRLDGPVDAVTIERILADERAGSDSPPVPPVPPVPVPVRRIRANAGQYVDSAVRVGVTYEYRVYVESADSDGRLRRTGGARITVAVTRRPLPVRDLAVVTAHGTTRLQWSAPPGEVRVYAVVVDETTPADPLGAEDTEIDISKIVDSARPVGASSSGYLIDPLAAGELYYIPVTVVDGRGVVGRCGRHLVAEGIRDLRADDRGDEIVLSFQMPPGVSEARVLWRRDQLPTGPDDPRAHQAKVTNTSLEIKGGWHLAAPRDGGAYFVACYPLVWTGGILKPAYPGTGIVARPAAEEPAPHRTSPSAGPEFIFGSVPDPPTGPGAGAASRGFSGSVFEPPPRARTVPVISPPVITASVPEPASSVVTARTFEASPGAVAAPVSEPAPSVVTAPVPEAAVLGPAVLGSAVLGPGRTVTYTVTRSGWRRRTLRVRLQGDGPLPALVLVARSGTIPPRSLGDGRTLVRLSAIPAHEHAVEVSLDGAQLPWGVRLFPAAQEHPAGAVDGDSTAVVVRHPLDDSLVVR